MTVFAYDGRFVAADRMITNDSGRHGICRKITVWEKHVLVTSGAADHGEALTIWFKDGLNPAAFPKAQAGDKDAYLYVFGYKVPVMCFQTWPSPVLFPMDFYAGGAGGDVAWTALHMGRDAREAAKIACELNIYCGGGVEYVDLQALHHNNDARVHLYTKD